MLIVYLYLICLVCFVKSTLSVNITSPATSSTTEFSATATDLPTEAPIKNEKVVQSVTEEPVNDVSTTTKTTTTTTTTSTKPTPEASTKIKVLDEYDRNLNRPILKVGKNKKLNDTSKEWARQHKKAKLESEKKMDKAKLERAERKKEKKIQMVKHSRKKSNHRNVDDVKNRNRPIKKKCPECEKKLLQKEMEENRKASLKQQLVDKLQLDLSLPVKTPVVPPEILRRSMMDDDSNNDHDIYATTTEIILTARDITIRCKNRKSTGCFKFNLRRKITGRVTSAELFVYKLHDPNDGQQSIFLQELERPKFRKLRPRNIVSRLDTDTTEGWLKFRVDNTVDRWLKNPLSNDGIAIKCKTCANRNYKHLYSAKEGYRPVLIVRMQPHVLHHRLKRSVECGSEVQGCCKHRFYVNFHDIGLIQILQPPGVMANYCTGSCDDDRFGHYNHTLYMQGVRFRSETANTTIRGAIRPCCGAVRLRTISMLVVDREGDLRHVHAPNVAVEECGCL